MSKFHVHAPPRRAVPPPYRPAAREHLICSARLGNFLQFCIYHTYFNKQVIQSSATVRLHDGVCEFINIHLFEPKAYGF